MSLLLDPIIINTETEIPERKEGLDYFIDYLSMLEGWKTKAKNLHWSAPKKNIHEYLDGFHKLLSDFQDSLAEGVQGILGHIAPNKIKPIECDALDALMLLHEVKNKTLEFYQNLPTEVDFVGVKSECETFIHGIWTYKYLFELADIIRI